MKTTVRGVVFSLAIGAALAGCPTSTNPGDGGDVQAVDATGSDVPASDVVGTDVQGSDCCEGPDVVRTDATGPDAPHRVPVNHRVDDSQCATTPPAGMCSFSGGPPSVCHADSDCTAGTNGRCAQLGGGIATCGCTYDTCTGDSACATGQTCACHGSTFVSTGNSCTAGNCRVDSDCGGGGYCSPSRAISGSCGGIGGYYCHTPSDECVDDADCTDPSHAWCSFAPATGHWVCSQVLLCG